MLTRYIEDGRDVAEAHEVVGENDENGDESSDSASIVAQLNKIIGTAFTAFLADLDIWFIT